MTEPIPTSASPPRRRRSQTILLIAMAVIFIVPAGAGFINKFIHFMQTVQTDEMGKSALVPMLNYLVVASGFTCLFVWALLRGMFRDVERPKYAMLENEARLDGLDSPWHKD